ncbi:hypothetical protein D3C72_1572200 [compost metagenome]
MYGSTAYAPPNVRKAALVKNQAICVYAPCQPYKTVNIPIGTAHIKPPAATMTANRGQRNLACSGVGVSSSISAGPKPGAPEPWRAPTRKCAGHFLPPMNPTNAAAATIKGNGTFIAKIATNAAAAMLQSAGFFSAREPIRCAACKTMAVTAGLIP